jgi:hypothetical protein
MRRIAVTILTLGLLWPLVGSSQEGAPGYIGSPPLRMGDSLMAWCRTEKGAETFLCMGYLAGVADALEAIAYTAGWGTSGVCRPRGTTLGRVRQAVLDWAKHNPAAAKRAGSVVVISALQEAFPCQPDQ